MSYAILRIRKLKTLGSVAGCGAHVHRKRPTANADPAAAVHILHGSTNLLDDVKAKLPAKLRANAVLAVEMILTASPEWFRAGGSVEDWTDMCLAWLEARYGNNCVNVTRHDDETSPHLHCVLLPKMPNGRLSCDHFFGTPAKLSKLQDDYADSMEPLGLERGIPRTQTKRKHQHIRRFYEMCNQVESRLDVGHVVAKLHQAINTTPKRPSNHGTQQVP